MEATRGVLYLIRNPLDVAVSFAHHGATSVDKMVARMNDPEYAFVDREDRLYNQLRQRLLTWSGHVISWVDAPSLDVHVVRYEDMNGRTLETFRKAVRYLGLADDVARIQKALAFSSFSELRRQEQERRFGRRCRSRRRSSAGARSGRGARRSHPSTRQLSSRRTGIMRRFGYLTEAGVTAFWAPIPTTVGESISIGGILGR